jgi:BirA family transcriptional regulator, biotin operon repressor / biotin---[acetyl-CoA-carboxylase] ligase
LSAVQLPGGYRLIALDSVGSTNDEAKRLARGGADHGTLIWAREQTAGRGRGGRVWASPRGNLYLSLVLKLGLPAAQIAELSYVSVVALGEALRPFLPPMAVLSYKWPNDLLLDGRKVAGILLETETAADWAVLGTGVNVASHPDDATYPATDLASTGTVPPLQTLLEAFMAHLDGWIWRWREAGMAPVRAAWLAHARGLGEPITVRLPDAQITGRFADLDPDGRLVLIRADGGTQLIAAGDVFFGRGGPR